MKKFNYTIFTLTLLVGMALYTPAFAVTHTVQVGNYYFNPSSLNVQVGDIVKWVWVVGSHTTTSSSVPAGAATWDEPITSGNQTYSYTVTTAGTYNYVCTPHAGMGMVASFVASSATNTLQVTPANQNVSAPSGTANFSVTSNTSWNASSDQTWCTVTPSGTGNGTIAANYTANPGATTRIATITVSASGVSNQVVTVTQAGVTATLVVTPPNQNVSETAGTVNFTVTSNTNWTASSDASWCTVTSSGSGNGILTANYAANSSSSSRLATITVSASGASNQVVTVTQAGAAPTLNVTPPSQSVTESSGTTTFTITSNSDWSASSDVSWCSVTPSGSRNGTVVATYDANTGNTVRTANISITVPGLSPEIVQVIQDGTSVGVRENGVRSISVFPNPARDVVKVRLDNISGDNVRISMSDIGGKIFLDSFSHGKTEVSLQVGDLPRGYYFVKVSGNDGTITRKVILAE
jgi:plastocyanin